MRNSSARVRRRKQRIAEMNVVPYIDVMLVLLIIFMTTSTFISEEKKLETPFSSSGRAISDNPRLILDELGHYQLKVDGKSNGSTKGKAVASDQELISMLKMLKNQSKNPQEFKVLLQASNDLKYGEIWKIKEKFKKEGLEINLVTSKK